MGEGPERVDPSGIPEFTGNLTQLGTEHAALTTDAGTIRETGSTIHTRFQGLSAFYTAPEADQLFATTTSVRDRADGFADDLETVGTALSDYADEITPIVARLAQLKTDATTFVNEIKDDDEWQYDGDKVEKNNQFVKDISTAVGQFWAAERTAANKITALVGGTQWVTDDGSGGKNMYGMSVEDMAQAGETPWGKAVEEKHHWYEIGYHLKSFVWDGIIVDGIWGTLTGLGTLVNPWSDNFGAAWKGLGQLATGLAILAVPLAFPVVMLAKDHLPGPVKNWVNDSLDTTLEVGKSLIAWDEWGKNPARAAGLVTFNIVTTVATLGTGTAVRGTASGASAASRAAALVAKVGVIIDPMTYIGKGLSAGVNGLSKLSEISGKLVDLSAIRAIELPDGALRLPDGVELPPAGHPLPDLPPGISAVELPDGSVRLPDGSTLAPDGTLKLPDGTTQKPAEVPAELSAGDRAILDAANPELAGVGAKQTPGNITAQVGDGLPPSGALPDNLPGGASPRTPGGTVPSVPASAFTDPPGTVPHTPGGGPPTGPGAPLDPPPAGGIPDPPGGAQPPPGSGLPGDATPPPGSHLPDDGLPTGPADDLGAGPTDDLPSGHPDDTPTNPVDDTPTGPADDMPGADPDNPPPPRPDEHSTPAQQRAWDKYWIDQVNKNGSPLEEYYRPSDGHRLSVDNGMPQIRFNQQTGLWELASDRPPPIPPKDFLDTASGTRATAASPETLRTLDDAAAARQTAIDDVRTSTDDLTNAKNEFDANPTDENAARLAEAQERYRAAQTAMGNAAENFGETVAAHQVIAEHYDGAVRQDLFGPANGNDQFDQVWRREDGGFVVIEAKSATSTPLGAREVPGGAYVSQGTRAYFDDIIRKMHERGRTHPSETLLADELEQALKAGKLDYIVVKGKPVGGQYGGYEMGKFDIG